MDTRGNAAVHIDTGMNRLGMSVAEAQALSPRAAQPAHGITLVMSHLACAEDLQHPLNGRQVAAFREVARLFTNVPPRWQILPAFFLGHSFISICCDRARRSTASTRRRKRTIRCSRSSSVKARVVQVRNVERGETVGYGATWTARRPTRLAIVAAGYADGYFRAAGGVDGVRTASALIGRTRCPIAGRISMDLMAIDITDLPSPLRRGQLVTLVGDGITVDELANHFGTIGYEVLTSLGDRYQRFYRGGPG